MKLGLWLLGAVAGAALISSVVEGHRASQAEATRDSALAVGALHARQAEAAQRAATTDSLRADSLLAVADHWRSLVRPPVPAPPVPRPDTTLRDSLRFWRDSAGVAQETAVQALQALQARSEEAEGLRGALGAEEAVAGHLRAALAEQTTRAEGAEAALKRMPTGCRKIFGLPIPRVGVGAALTVHGIEPALALTVGLGGC